MTQGTNTAGGFLVPEIWALELLKLDGYAGMAISRVKRYLDGYGMLNTSQFLTRL